MIRKVIELSEIIDKNCISQESDFEYAGIKGYAEFIGWKLVFFRQNKNSCFYDAVSFFDIEGEEVDLCNTILKNSIFLSILILSLMIFLGFLEKIIQQTT